jgi:AbrB family looped-hinge helix DNA binding protein
MDVETRTRVNENGRVVIPASYRKALGIKAGDEVILRMEDDELRITTMKRRIERAQRRIRQYVKPGVSLADELIAERREAAKRERLTSKIVLDASAMLAVLNHEPGSEKLTPEMLSRAAGSTVNLAEVHTKLVSRGGDPDEAWEDALSAVMNRCRSPQSKRELQGIS